MVGGTNPGQVTMGAVRKLAEQEPAREVMKQHLPTVLLQFPRQRLSSLARNKAAWNSKQAYLQFLPCFLSTMDRDLQ